VGSSRTIDVHIRRIRASLSASDYEYIHTARGLGYRFEARPKGTGDDEISPVVERETVEPPRE
jgi:DNA-binding winged helix-turn-helix (wHTH) protein